MHDVAGPGNRSAGYLADRLVAEADAKNRGLQIGLAERPTEDVQADARLVRSAWTGGEHNPIRPNPLDFRQIDFVVSLHEHFDSALPQILDQVIGEGIKVVDDENHAPIVVRDVPRGVGQ